MANKTGIIWIVIAIFYFIYSAMLAKHGLMFIKIAKATNYQIWILPLLITKSKQMFDNYLL